MYERSWLQPDVVAKEVSSTVPKLVYGGRIEQNFVRRDRKRTCGREGHYCWSQRAWSGVWIMAHTVDIRSGCFALRAFLHRVSGLLGRMIVLRSFRNGDFAIFQCWRFDIGFSLLWRRCQHQSKDPDRLQLELEVGRERQWRFYSTQVHVRL